MRQLIVKACCLLPLAALVVGLSALVDPSKILSGGAYERQFADWLLEGRNVAGLGDYNDRLLQQYYVEGLHSRLDIVVIGSSRSMYVRARFFNSEAAFFNNSVTMASLEDMIAIRRIYEVRGILPKKLILGVDDWTFCQGDGQNNLWLGFDEKYLADMDRPLRLRFRKFFFQCERYGQLLSPGYFHVAAWNLLKGVDYKAYTTAAEFAEDTAVKLADGSINYRRTVRQRSEDEVKIIAGLVERRSGPLRGFGEGPQARRLEGFLRLAQGNGSRVILFLPPYHPRAFSLMREPLERGEAYLRDIAGRLGLQVVGSYDPSVAGCNAGEFFDEGHPREECLERIFRSVGGEL